MIFVLNILKYFHLTLMMFDIQILLLSTMKRVYSPPISQRSYNLPQKHVAWVQKELETLKRVGVIVQSVSPLAGSIVVIQKQTQLEEPSRQGLYVDYRALDTLLLPVTKLILNLRVLNLGSLTEVPFTFQMSLSNFTQVSGLIPVIKRESECYPNKILKTA